MVCDTVVSNLAVEQHPQAVPRLERLLERSRVAGERAPKEHDLTSWRARVELRRSGFGSQ